MNVTAVRKVILVAVVKLDQIVILFSWNLWSNCFVFSKESETVFLVTGNDIVTYQVFQEYHNLFFVANGT